MRYLTLTAVNPDTLESDDVFILSTNAPMGIARYNEYTILNFGTAESIIVTETPEEVMAMFGAIIEKRDLQ
jgi:hypothetical protein